MEYKISQFKKNNLKVAALCINLILKNSKIGRYIIGITSKEQLNIRDS